MSVNIYNPATGQTGYQVPGASPPSGWLPIPASGVPSAGGSTTSSVGTTFTPQQIAAQAALTPAQNIAANVASTGNIQGTGGSAGGSSNGAGGTTYMYNAAGQKQVLAPFDANIQALSAQGYTFANDPTAPLPTTGNSNLDTAQSGIASAIASGAANGVIPPGLQITPALTAQFLTWAHQVVDPQTQQALTAEATNINNYLNDQQNQFNASQGEIEQGFGTSLATEQNAAGGAGTAFSGQRGVDEGNLQASANRSLASLRSTTDLNIGNALNSGTAAVGASNANMFNLPTIAPGSVSTLGGQRGSTSANGIEASGNFGYNPNNYTVGTIGSGTTGGAGAAAVNAQEANYLNQYNTLAANNSSRSIGDLIGGISGLPAGYTVPAGLS